MDHLVRVSRNTTAVICVPIPYLGQVNGYFPAKTYSPVFNLIGPDMNTQTIKLAIIDEAPIVSEGLLFTLQRFSNLEVVTATTTINELLYHMQQKHVDILLVDILRYMQGDQLVRKVKEKFPCIKILVLSMNNHDKNMVHCVLNDDAIDGYLSDKAGLRELITAVERIARGGGYFSADLPCGTPAVDRKSNGVKLTGRELEIIRLIEKEYNNRQIARSLFISERTVETHRKHIYQKTCTNNVIALIKYAYSHKLVD
jgi:two-component system nitrate/nitrite response regulator NarL